MKLFRPSDLVAFLPVLWAALACVGVEVVFLLIKRAGSRKFEAKLLKLGIEDIDKLSGRDFERLLRRIFDRKGYKVELTPCVNDHGADLVATKVKARIVIQAKRSARRVGVAGIQQVVASIPVYKATQGMVVTNNFYTQAARRLATANKVTLWDRSDLRRELSALDFKEG